MPFLFCFVYARLPFFRNFYGEKKRCTPPIVAEKMEKHFLCRYALGFEVDISLYLSEAIRQSEYAIRAHSLITVEGIIMHLRCPSEVVIELCINGKPLIYAVFNP